MLSNIGLKSFKAFENESIELKPITIFLGPNNAGKSSALASLRLLVQTIESYDNRIPLLLNGILGDFGTYRDIVFQNSKKRHIDIDLTLTPPYHFNTPKSINIDKIYLHLTFKYRSKRREIILNSIRLKTDNNILFESEYYDDSERQLIQRIGNKEVPSSLKSVLSKQLRMQNFVPQYFPYFQSEKENSAVSDFVTEEVRNNMRIINRVGYIIEYSLRNIEYLGAMRVPPERTYLYTGERRQRIGSKGENSANIIAMDDARSGSKSQNIVKRLGNWLNKAGMGQNIKIENISERHYEIRIKHPKSSESQNFADTGYGNSQVLPVIIGGLNLEKNASYIIEQPEIHLHPKAQSELGDYFLNLYLNGNQSIIETHSEHMVLRLQQHVANQEIKPDDILFYYIYSTSDGKQIKKLTLDEKGRFNEDWPEGFFPERLEEAKKLSKIRFSEYATKKE